ncbi:hypothetical protein N9B94_02570 [Verrucomicrobia bacterium]|nr:hypothetical protein [Verrucomicrobiota bacterium]
MAGVVHKYDAITLKVKSSFGAHDRDTKSMAVSPSESLIATGDINGLIRFWKPGSNGTFEFLGELFEDAAIKALDFSPSGKG